MAHEIKIPRLGWSMEVGTFLGWLKSDGDLIHEGDPLYEIESEKASQEIESIDAGILRIPPDGPQVGAELPVGTVLGYVVAIDEPVPWELPPTGEDDSSAVVKPRADEVSHERTDSQSSFVRKFAKDLDVSLTNVVGSGRNGTIANEDMRDLYPSKGIQDAANAKQDPENGKPPPEGNSRIVATPRAKRVAAELNLDLENITGTGRNGRVRESDVRHAADLRQMASSTSAAADGVAIPTTEFRPTIAQQTVHSHQTAAPVTLTTLSHVENLLNTRSQFRAVYDKASLPSLSAIMLKLVANVLQKHPALAGQWQEDHILLPSEDGFNIGLAVDTKDGLVVPVVKNAAQLSLTEIAKTTAMLIEKARGGNLTMTELEGGVFTITNLGRLGIDGFTSIINGPKSAVLGIGAIRREAVVIDDSQIGVGSRMTLSLTFDHHVCDGIPAAKFLADIRAAIENPVPFLV